MSTPAILAPEEGVVSRPVGQVPGQVPRDVGMPKLARVVMWGVIVLMIISPLLSWSVQTNDLLVDSAGRVKDAGALLEERERLSASVAGARRYKRR